MSESNSIIEEIEKSKNYDAVFMTTFNFDVAFFEKYLLHLFLNNNVRFINLFVDSKQLHSALSEQKPSHFGRKYYVSPININGAFHPKVILMLAKNKAKLIVTSANIKLTGYMTNSEVFQTFYYDEEHLEYGNLIMEAVRFFTELSQMTPAPDQTTTEMLRRYQNKAADSDQKIWVLSNLRGSILDQMRSIIHEDASEIRIAVPFYDQQLTALNRMQELFRCNNLKLYIQNETSTFPQAFNEENEIVSEDRIKTFESVNWASGEKYSFYHGKVIEIDCSACTYVLYGSANCTASALINEWRTGGNIECDVLEVKDTNSSSFFINFNVKYVEDFKTILVNVDSNNDTGFYFVYSQIEKESLIVHIGYKCRMKDLLITFGKTALDYKYADRFLDVIIPLSLFKDAESVFDLNIHADTREYTVPCWFINLMSLDYFRKNIASFLPTEIPDEAETERFNEYTQGLLDALFNDEWNEYASELKAELSSGILPASDNESESETVENDQEDILDFVLEKDISDRLIQRNTLFQTAYPVARQFAARYYEALLKKEYQNPETTQSAQALTLRTYAPRKATSSEKRLARFIRRNLKQHFLITDTSRLTYDYYLNICGVILYIMHKMKYYEHVTDFMPDDESLRIRTMLVELLLDKFKMDNANKDQELLCRVTLMTIIELGTYRESTKDAKAKKMLLALNEIINVRDTYKKRLKELELRQIVDQNDTFNPVNYVGKLFGYKTYEELQDYLNELYKGNARLFTIQDVFTVQVLTKAPERIADIMIVEVLRYLDVYNKKIKRVEFNYIPPTGTKVLYTVKFAGTHVNSVTKTFIRSNGGRTQYRCTKEDKNWKASLPN